MATAVAAAAVAGAALLLFIAGTAAAAPTIEQDTTALRALMFSMKNMPPGWGRSSDPCGSEPWEGVTCGGSRVTQLKLYNMGLRGTLSGDIGSLTALQRLDLSYNTDLGGQLTPAVGNLKQLDALILVGCGFSGSIPSEIGKLTQLTFLALNSNQFTGTLPASLGSLSNLSWLDLAENQLSGPLPVSNGSTPGLDQLVNTKHFHLNKNSFTGPIPEKLFSSNMKLIHLLLDRNQLDGPIPASIGSVETLEIIRLDNNWLEGAVPSNINNLTHLSVLHLANNRLIGPMPNLTGMNTLNYVDLSNNSFDPSETPAWLSELENLTTLIIESGNLHGQVPEKLFSYTLLQQVILKNNSFSGKLDLGSNVSQQLQIVNIENNNLSSVELGTNYNNSIMLSGNPVCRNVHLSATNYCLLPQQSSSDDNIGLSKCNGKPCPTNNTCSHPYKGNMIFRAPNFRDLTNKTPFLILEDSIWKRYQQAVGSISLQNPLFNNDSYLEVQLLLCPLNGTHFNIEDILVNLDLSSNSYTAPDIFGPSYYEAFPYKLSESSPINIGLIVGLSVGCALLVCGLAGAGLYASRQKKRAKMAIELSNPFASWEGSSDESGAAPQWKGTICFSYEELKKCTNNFPEINVIGSGGYGKVYRGMLQDGRMVAIKRSKAGSSQGGLEFKTEIELLSRVHHKNLVCLVGFCFQQGERILVYEYIPNGTLSDGLSGRSGIELDWTRRLRIALDSARGLAYLHELANPAIIHRDIKSTNILLDHNINAKVSDFGLSKLLSDGIEGNVTEVKGTLGYLDPEYYMTQVLTEKSDVYSFGVVMLELVTGKMPIEEGKYIVNVVKSSLDQNDVYYGLRALIDPIIREATYLVGFRRFVELALQCVEDSAVDRPTMNEVVKQIEAMLTEGTEADTKSGSYSSHRSLYNDVPSQKQVSSSFFKYSASYSLPTMVEPK